MLVTPAMSRLATRALVVASLVFACGCGGSTGTTGTDGDAESLDPDESALTGGWSAIGNGVAYKSTGAGDGVFIGYAGYSVTIDRSAAWVDALVDARLRTLHVGHVYAVRGPTDPRYAAKDIGNTKLAAHLVGGPGPAAPFVLVAAHSSGSYVAHELLGQVFDGDRDPDHVLANKVVYADLDGGEGGLDAHIFSALHHIAFVWADDTKLSQGRSANGFLMESLGEQHPHGGIGLIVDHSGCESGAKWCLHDLLITTRPHNPATFDLVRDYTDFAGRPVQDGWIRQLESYLPQ